MDLHPHEEQLAETSSTRSRSREDETGPPLAVEVEVDANDPTSSYVHETSARAEYAGHPTGSYHQEMLPSAPLPSVVQFEGLLQPPTPFPPDISPQNSLMLENMEPSPSHSFSSPPDIESSHVQWSASRPLSPPTPTHSSQGLRPFRDSSRSSSVSRRPPGRVRFSSTVSIANPEQDHPSPSLSADRSPPPDPSLPGSYSPQWDTHYSHPPPVVVGGRPTSLTADGSLYRDVTPPLSYQWSSGYSQSLPSNRSRSPPPIIPPDPHPPGYCDPRWYTHYSHSPPPTSATSRGTTPSLSYDGSPPLLNPPGSYYRQWYPHYSHSIPPTSPRFSRRPTSLPSDGSPPPVIPPLPSPPDSYRRQWYPYYSSHSPLPTDCGSTTSLPFDGLPPPVMSIHSESPSPPSSFYSQWYPPSDSHSPSPTIGGRPTSPFYSLESRSESGRTQDISSTPQFSIHDQGVLPVFPALTPLISRRSTIMSVTDMASNPTETASEAGNVKEDAHALSDKGSGANSHMAGAQLPEIRPPPQDSQSQAAPVPPPLVGEIDMWSIYIERTLEEDKETVEAWNGDLDSLLLFAALFSAVLTTFVVESSQKLQQDDSAELLRAILLEIKATQINSNSSSRPVPAAFEVTGAAVRVNAYWFSSLVISLAAALITILAKQWVNYLLAGLSPLPVAGARHRQYRIDGMHKWKLPFVISVLPVFLHVSLLLFFAGLVDFVWDLNDSLGILIALLVIVTSAIYFTANVVAYIYPDCPYKTSVAVFFGQAFRLGTQLYRRLSMATLLAHEVLQVVLSSPGQTLSGPQLAASREVKASEALRVLSLRHEEKVHVQRNASLIDAKILHWLLQKETRLPDTKQLGWKLMHFPDLLHHQQLLIDTRSYELLESLFSNCYVASYARLSAASQGELSTVLRTLATLESESSVSEKTLVPFDTSRRGTSSRSTTAVVPASPVHIRMSATSTKLVRRLLEELNTLPSLSLMAFTLRLAARMLLVSNRRRDWVLVSRGTLLLLRRILAHGVAYDQASEEDRKVDSEQDLADAVNTVLYVALHDTMFPEWKLMQSAGYSEQWFVVLPDMMARAPLDPVSRRQIAWAICILAKEHRPLEAWNGYGPGGKYLPGPQLPSPPPPAATLLLPLINMLVRIVGDANDGPVRHDMLNAVVVAVDKILRDIVAPVDKLQAQALRDAIPDACDVYGDFLGLLHTKLQDRILPTEILQEYAFPVEKLQRILFPVVRIATTLSAVYRIHGGRVHTPLLIFVLSLLRTLITSTPPLPQWLGSTNTLDGSTLRQWAYRAACSIVKLYLISQDETTEEGPYIARTLASSPELAFPDVSSAGAAAFEFVAALELITKHDLRPDCHQAERATLLATFFAITKDIFVKNVDVDPLDWDWNAIRITAHFVQQGGLSALVASAYPPVHTALFAPAITELHTLFFAPTTGNGRRSFPPPTPNDRRHPVNKVASAIANPYMQFLRRLEETIWKGTFRDIGRRGLLEKITDVAGYLALFENPARWPNLDGVASMQSFFSAVLFARAVRASHHVRPGGHVRSPARVPQPMYEPEEIAAGLVRVLAVMSGCKTFGHADEHAHCPECTPTRAELDSVEQSLSWSSANGWESRPALWAMTRFTLWTIHSIWSSRDRKSVRLRRGLLEHDLASRIRYFQLWQGEIGLVANSMAFRIGGTRMPLLLEQ